MNERRIPIVSASIPCKGGKTAPPRIIIISIEEASAVRFSNPSIARVKTFDHIIELNKPMANNDQTAIVPLESIAVQIKTTFSNANMASRRDGMPFPRWNPKKLRIIKARNTAT